MDQKTYRDSLIEEFNAIIAVYQKYDEELKKPIPEVKHEKLDERSEEIHASYFKNLPQLVLSCCPYCKQPFSTAIDPWGIDGFWWQSSELTVELPMTHCEHFLLMQGALHLNGLPPKGGHHTANTGPEQPFVAPRILQEETVKLIVSQLEMTNGYTAYPLIYFAQDKPHPSQLMETWRNDSYGWTLDNGRSVWSIATDPWDFDLKPWITQKKIGWISKPLSHQDIHSASETTKISNPEFGTYTAYPFQKVEGRKTRIHINAEGMYELSVPDGDDVDPF